MNSVNKFDPQNRHVKRHIFLTDDSYLSIASAKNVFFILLVCTALLLGSVFTFAPESELYHRVIGICFFGLIALAYGCRDKIFIANGVLELAYGFDLFGVKKVFKLRRYDLSGFNRAVVRWRKGGSNGQMSDKTAHLYMENDFCSICLISFHLKDNGQDLWRDFIRQIEPIIGLKVKDEADYLRSLKDDEANKES